MKQYVGLDISMEETSICVLDQAGDVTFEGCAPTNPEAIAKLLRRHAGTAERIVFETGSLSNWLWHQLRALGFPVICLDARHANAALSMAASRYHPMRAISANPLASFWCGELENPFDGCGSKQAGGSAA
ncbi:transposase [Bradyrhizobium sp. ERR14]|uniref:IS110 family transposase n=1 Tax=Bradyrhizobium sp. ERR14 TaxID=2663837 RepID=UPI001619166F|nr:transposase [Bradyrhizobium sp. ERR14]MBB4399018.1 transposase [Bradyrhizobium sp. ERR14]